MAEDTPSVSMTCEVCSEYYTDPLMLPCLHSFCKKCIIKAKEKEGSPDTSLKCPTCDTISFLYLMVKLKISHKTFGLRNKSEKHPLRIK